MGVHILMVSGAKIVFFFDAMAFFYKYLKKKQYLCTQES